MHLLVVATLVLQQQLTPSAIQPTLKTRWTDSVNRKLPHNEYPRPTMVRDRWTNLNGEWDFAIQPPSVEREKAFTSPSKIVVPFPVESYLSGVQRAVPSGHKMWYRRTFTPPKGARVLLHFGAADWETNVWINGQTVGHHRGGYDAFTFDITDSIGDRAKPSEIVVEVTDPTDSANQPRGKQVRKPGGIFYTPTSGIWQTVWLESVPECSIDDLKIETHPKAGQIEIRTAARGLTPLITFAEVLDHGKVVARAQNDNHETPLVLKVPSAIWWTPSNPYLYDLRVGYLSRGGEVIDSVKSYVAFRTLEIGKDASGTTRMMLNGKPTFFCGPLDQGFWPDGIYTPPTDAAMRYDLEVTKRLGFNTIRKHVKVEPETWYSYCDRMGILVFQDMPSGSGFIGGRDPDLTRNIEDAEQFKTELKALIDTHRNHPSIAMWVVFNEGWGQHDTGELTDWVKRYDPTRFVNNASGWSDRGHGDVHDIHNYPHPAVPKLESTRAAMLGEFGGLGLPTPSHMWQATGWGYQSFKTNAELTDAMEKLFVETRFLIGSEGLCSAIYTQTTDVETELNGLMTYDRAIVKVDSDRIGRSVRNLYLPAPVVQVLIPTAEKQPQTWTYTTEKPANDWMRANASTDDWKQGIAPFASPGTPGVQARTEWNSADIWLRRSIVFADSVPMRDLILTAFHDEDIAVYLDGSLIAKASGYTTSYANLPFVGTGSVTKGSHMLAVHCHQTQGGQGVDVGISRVIAAISGSSR